MGLPSGSTLKRLREPSLEEVEPLAAPSFAKKSKPTLVSMKEVSKPHYEITVRAKGIFRSFRIHLHPKTPSIEERLKLVTKAILMAQAQLPISNQKVIEITNTRSSTSYPSEDRMIATVCISISTV